MNQLNQLRQYTTIVADTGDFHLIEAFSPQDSTTNPSLILRAVQKEAYRSLLEKIVAENRLKPIETIIDALLISFGAEILKIVPGRVSTEVDARLSFDTQATITKARSLIARYKAAGVNTERVLIKIAATWEGIQAARILEQENIHCNMTLMFAMPQAVCCAHANVQLISPFVGRIYDWYKKNTGHDYVGDNDPGVQSVKAIYNYYRKFHHKTEVMGASFRNTSQLIALAGCDLLTISPDLLKQLTESSAPVTQQLSAENAQKMDIKPLQFDESSFRLAMNDNAMATEKLAEGIRQFCRDTEKLESLIKQWQ